VSHADGHRTALGFLPVAATDELGGQGVRVLDPHSTLISSSATFGAGTVIYPGVVISTEQRSRIDIGEGCVLYPGCLLEARDGGRLVIGDDVELGPGGVTIRAGSQDAIVVDDHARLSGNCELSGGCELGRGAQILGPISARSVRLGGGRGGYRWPNPDERGAVLKGVGLADGITLAQGEVRSCRPSFGDVPTERQSRYHPRPTTGRRNRADER